MDIFNNGKSYSFKIDYYEELPISLWAELVRILAGYRCENCGTAQHFTDGGRTNLSAHHIVPISAGGKTTLHNGICLCLNCHHKADREYNLGITGPEFIRSLKKHQEYASVNLKAFNRVEINGNTTMIVDTSTFGNMRKTLLGTMGLRKNRYKLHTQTPLLATVRKCTT